MKFHRFALVLIPLGPLVVGFGGCGITVNEGTSSAGGSVTAVSVGSSSSSSGAITTGVDAGEGGQIAAACTSDADCGGDLTCLRPSGADPIFGGGAPNGFCTKDCTLDAECAREGGICYRPDPSLSGRCTLACEIGAPITSVAGLFDVLPPNKCRARDDARCVPFASTAGGTASDGACVPTCSADAQCPGGGCDPRAAVCVTTPSTGQPTGSACDPTVQPVVCAGLCVAFQTGAAMCSEPCVLGGAGIESPSCGSAAEGLCAFHPTTNGAGDTGFCTPSCAAQTDCQNPSFWCFGVPPLTAMVKRGYCFAATPCPNGPSDCPAPGDAGDAPVYTCTATTEGPLCLDATFPFDADAGPGDAGPGDAGLGDAGLGDAGLADADAPDAGPDDGGGYDGGEYDAGWLDAGDAGWVDDGGWLDAGDGG